MPDMMSMMPKNLPEDKKGQWKKHYSEAMQEEGMTPEKAASMATEKCMKQNQRGNRMKLSLNGLIGYLQGKGWKVHVNEDAETEDATFEVVEEPTADEPEVDASEPMLSEEELKALKGFATILAKNSQLLDEKALVNALAIVPAAAQLVQNAQEREKLEKESIIATIKANSSNIYTDDELNGMSLPVLNKMNTQMNVSYLGMGGATFQNAEEALTLPTGLLSLGQEVSDGS